MKEILNRIAWAASFGMGFFLVFIFAVAFDVLDSRYAFDDDTFWFWLIITSLISVAFKAMAFSGSNIEKAVAGYEGLINTRKEEESIKEFMNQVPSPVYDKKEEKKDVELGPEGELPAFIAEKVKEEEQKPEEKDSAIVSAAENVMAGLSGGRAVEKIEEDIPEAPEAPEIPEAPVPPSEPGFFENFFKENALAKVGGILMFLAVLFLLQWAYTILGPIGKMISGFAVSFVIFFTALLLEKKGFEKEARIMFGTSILINYLVILAGRYLIYTDAAENHVLLGEALAFFFLILNTVFAVTVSMAHKSRALMIFSFVAAYLNPFLVGFVAIGIHTIISYSLLVSLAAVAMAWYYRGAHESYPFSLLSISFVAGNTLIVLAPMTTELDWVIKVLALAFLSLIICFMVFKQNMKQLLLTVLSLTYVFFMAMLFQAEASIGSALAGTLASTMSLIFIFLFMFLGVFLISAGVTASLAYVFVAPLLIIFTMFGSGTFSPLLLPFVVPLTIISFAFVIRILLTRLGAQLMYGLMASLGVFLVSMNTLLSSLIARGEVLPSLTQFYALVGSVMIFFLSALYFSKHKDYENLYAISSFLTALVLYSILDRSAPLMFMSIVVASVFVFINVLWPILNRRLLLSNIGNLLFGLLFGVIFAVAELYYFFMADQGYSKISLGLFFMLLAIIYFFFSYYVHLNFRRLSAEAGVDIDRQHRSQVLYSYLGISISLFSLAVAYVFSTSREVVAIIWLFESSLLMYMYHKLRENKLFIGAVVLMFLGLGGMLSYIGQLRSGEFYNVIPFLLTLTALFLGLKFSRSENKQMQSFYEFGHILGIVILASLVYELVPRHAYGTIYFAYSIYAAILAVCYSLLEAKIARRFFVFASSFLFLWHISLLPEIFRYLEYQQMEVLKVFQYLSTLIFAISCILFYKGTAFFGRQEKDKFSSYLYLIFFLVYLFIISTQYLYLLFDKNMFAVTIYWGILSLFVLTHGIQKSLIGYRTVGLYILMLTTIKILLLDIWSGFDEPILRVVALMVVGAIMIGISILYTRKYGGDLKGELDLSNLGLKE